MSRVGATSYYFLEREYVVALREALGPRLKLAVVEIGDVVAAAGLFVETCGIIEYHLSGSDPAFARERPTKLMLHHVRGWAKARGNTAMHLGGGLGGAEDSLFEFKAGFSKLRAPFHTLRIVINDAAYRALSHSPTTDSVPFDTGDLTGFFPAYRRQ
jgi:lipid II:glycine glycyltransferase (peptidoglycan interpeptide bridge formation enzyme)